ncbi:hypothetical protein Nepgr_000501 [Nepenthes gracilis]|uniref:Gnk2-homologous domain-containing protein n=1 Tax=Nepenthes gracilis TaxID=150966 RepID=A0AAD3P3X5_NEPGR|nr:hypothetical protein Nepgr_000501 [Nepenthes gracilis]
MNSLLQLLCFSLLLHVVIGADPLSHVCSASGNYAANSPYDTNLNQLETYLYYQTPWWGFAMGSVGSSPNQAYGLAQCRADISFADCQTCVAQARDNIGNFCPYNKGGIIWYDYCLLKFLDQNFFHQIDNQNKFYQSNSNEVSDPTTFDENVKELLSQLSQQASVHPKLFATGETDFNQSTKIYGLAQCTRDLTNPDCEQCLQEAINDLPSCCGGKQAGSVFTGSCNVRYAINPL